MGFILHTKLKKQLWDIKNIWLRSNFPKTVSRIFFKIKKMPLNILIYCKFHIAQRISIEDICNIDSNNGRSFISPFVDRATALSQKKFSKK